MYRFHRQVDKQYMLDTYALNIDGMSMMGGGGGENVGMVVISLEHWSQRTSPEKSVSSILGRIRSIVAGMPEAQINAYAPPAIMGLGNSSGLEMQLQSTLENDPKKLSKGCPGPYLG